MGNVVKQMWRSRGGRMRLAGWLGCLLILPAVASAADGAGAAKELSGMSILGNSEAPKSLVIVPWKSSEIGDGIGLANLLDERARPVDRDVFLRELGYWELRTGGAAGPPAPPEQ